MQNQKIESLKGTEIWADVTSYFQEAFEAMPGMDEFELTADQLASDMHARFKKKYDPEAILQLMENGFKKLNRVVPPAHGEPAVSADIYLFRRGDFFPVPVRFIEGMKS